MSALTIERKTARVGSSETDPNPYQHGMATNVKILAGSVVCSDAAGDLTPGASGTGLTAVGVADTTYDNTGGATGATSARAFRGTWLLDNGTTGAVSGGTVRGTLLYLEDDHTVTTTSTTHSIAGRFWGMDPDGSGQVAVMIGVEIGSGAGAAGATGATGPTGPTGPTSLAMFKTDIAPLVQSDLALQALAIEPCTYRYKDEPSNAKRHLGFLIDQVGQDSHAVDASGTHVDLYGYTTMLLALCKEQQRQIDRLSAEVADLKRSA